VGSLRLSAEMMEVWEHNPHIRQVLANRREFHPSKTPLSQSDRIVTPQSGRLAYQRRQGEAKTVCHWGQRKLILSEIEFLTNYGEKSHLVVYAGAAPGTHTNFLAAELFPDLSFVLIDPARFDAVPTPKIKIINDYFDDNMAYEYADEKTIFICDIRSMDQGMTDAEKEGRVVVDMQAQRKWHNIIKPAASMLKFRLPYEHGTTEYLDGDIYFQVWAGRTSSETRLVVTSHETKQYSHQDYEDLMFCFNTETRTTYWPHSIQGEGLDHCYDCAGEVYILQNFLKKVRGITDEEELVRETTRLSRIISDKISKTGRNLND